MPAAAEESGRGRRHESEYDICFKNVLVSYLKIKIYFSIISYFNIYNFTTIYIFENIIFFLNYIYIFSLIVLTEFD